MIKLKDLLSETQKLTSESSLSRIWQHVTNEKEFAVVSAYQLGKTDKKNEEAHEQLKRDARSMGLGYIEQRSGYTYTDPDAGSDSIVKEKSLFLPNASLNDAMKLGKKYDQESVLYKNEDGLFLLSCKDGSKLMTFATKKGDRPLTFEPEVLKYAFSQLVKAGKSQRQKQYAFKAQELRVPTRTEAMMAMKDKSIVEAKWIDTFK